MTGSINNIALSGIQNGLNNLDLNTSRIAHKTTGDEGQSLTSSLVDIKTDIQQINASAKFLKVNDQLIGAILDIKV